VAGDAAEEGCVSVLFALVVLAASAVHCAPVDASAIPGMKPPRPGSHFEVCSRRIEPSELNAVDRLEGACDMTDDVLSDLKHEKMPDKKLRDDVEELRSFACNPPKSK
jgi:hypothetical protein